MTAKKLLVFGLFWMCQLIFAQQDSIVLKEVNVADTSLRNFSKTQMVSVLNDSVIAKNNTSLTSLLNYNSVLYFKENGYGMVSSPSFRGTTAQQTAVIWNGININSQLNGQTDFNTIPLNGFDEIAVRSGGGSSIYGSSAIGGSIHLNNELHFKNRFDNELRLSYGSFSTVNAAYNLRASNRQMSAELGVSRNSSDNDYEYPNTKNKHNENGQYYNSSMNAAFGYRISNRNFVKMYSQIFEGERHFSGTLAAKSKSKYQDLNSRNLLEWDSFFGTFISKLKFAWLSEQYKYFENAQTAIFETSKAETLVAKYDLLYSLPENMSVNAIADYTQTKGVGEQISENARQVGSGALLFRHAVTRHFGYEASVKKEITNNYQSPLLFALGSHYAVFKNYTLLFNVSKNFRIPSFNDLYWQQLGNPDLKPERSYQAELGQQFKTKTLAVAATAYYISIDQMIQWAPSANGVWRPENVAEVRSYGAELSLDMSKRLGRHSLNLHSNYAYTISEDWATKEQLIYVPVHKANINLAYAFQNFSADCQFLYNGMVYTPSQKYRMVDGYFVSNAGIAYEFGKSTQIKAGFRVLNIWNEDYQSVLQRPMPGRNYSISLTLKF